MQQEANSLDKVVIWYYEQGSKYPRRKCIYNHCKKLIYEMLYRGITRHGLKEIYFLVKLLPRSTAIDSYAMFRYIMILINSLNTDKVHKNFIIYLEASLSRYDLSKPDVFVEFLSYLIKNDRVEDARELYNKRHKYMSYQFHRHVPFNDVNIACYGLLMNYLDWQQRTPSQDDANFDVSIQGWLVNGMKALKQVEHNYEFFIMCIANVLCHYGLYKKLYLLVHEFQQANPDNMTGNLLLYNIIQKLTDNRCNKRRRNNTDHGSQTGLDDLEETRREHCYNESKEINNFDPTNESFEFDKFPTSSDDKLILSNLIRLDPRREEILNLSAKYNSKLEDIQVVMDSLMEVPLMRDKCRWRCLRKLLDEILSSGDPALIGSLKTLWQTKYQKFWRVDDFLQIPHEELGNPAPHRLARASVIERVIGKLREFDCELSGSSEDDEMEVDEFFPGGQMN